MNVINVHGEKVKIPFLMFIYFDYKSPTKREIGI